MSAKTHALARLLSHLEGGTMTTAMDTIAREWFEAQGGDLTARVNALVTDE